MTGDDITPDRLRLAGWDDDRGEFRHEGLPGAFVRVSPFNAERWYWYSPAGPMLAVALAGMADLTARLAIKDPK